MSDPDAIGGAYTISCNGVPMLKPIEAIRVTQGICAPTMFEVVISAESMEDPWWAMTLDEFEPGDEIGISLGSQHAKRLVTGPITMIWPDLNAEPGKPSKVTIAGFDHMVRLRFGTHTRVFEEFTDHRIVKKIAEAAGLLPVEMDDLEGKPRPYILQDNESDYDFLLRLCAQRNYELLMKETVRGPTLVFRPSAQGLPTDETLLYHRDFESISLQLSVPERGSRVEALGFSVETGSGKDLIGRAYSRSTERDKMDGKKTGYEMASRFPSSMIVFERPDFVALEAAQDFAEAQYTRGFRSFIRGKLRLCNGNSAMAAGMNVQVTGLGGRFNGLYYIDKAVHEYKDGFYSTEIEVRRSGI
jgi:phage protein D